MRVFSRLQGKKSGGRVAFLIASIVVAAVMAPNALAEAGAADSQGQRMYMEIEVERGDTLWGIAGRHMTGGDVRRSVHELCMVNGISAGELKAGQTLVVPVD